MNIRLWKAGVDENVLNIASQNISNIGDNRKRASKNASNVWGHQSA